MRKPRFALILFELLGFGVFLAVPAEDVPETAYDESQSLPYESTPLFSIMLQESARALQSALTLAFQLHFHPTARGDEILAEQSVRTQRPVSDFVTILDHSLRC